MPLPPSFLVWIFLKDSHRAEGGGEVKTCLGLTCYFKIQKMALFYATITKIKTTQKIWAAQFLCLLVCCDEALNLVGKVIIVTLWPLLCSLIGLCRRGCALVNSSLLYDLHCPFL